MNTGEKESRILLLQSLRRELFTEARIGSLDNIDGLLAAAKIVTNKIQKVIESRS